MENWFFVLLKLPCLQLALHRKATEKLSSTMSRASFSVVFSASELFFFPLLLRKWKAKSFSSIAFLFRPRHNEALPVVMKPLRWGKMNWRRKFSAFASLRQTIFLCVLVSENYFIDWFDSLKLRKVNNPRTTCLRFTARGGARAFYSSLSFAVCLKVF